MATTVLRLDSMPTFGDGWLVEPKGSHNFEALWAAELAKVRGMDERGPFVDNEWHHLAMGQERRRRGGGQREDGEEVSAAASVLSLSAASLAAACLLPASAPARAAAARSRSSCARFARPRAPLPPRLRRSGASVGEGSASIASGRIGTGTIARHASGRLLAQNRIGPVEVHRTFDPNRVPHHRTTTDRPFDPALCPSASKVLGARAMGTFTKGSTRQGITDLDRCEPMAKGVVEGGTGRGGLRALAAFPVSLRTLEPYHDNGNPAKAATLILNGFFLLRCTMVSRIDTTSPILRQAMCISYGSYVRDILKFQRPLWSVSSAINGRIPFWGCLVRQSETHVGWLSG
ncbi:unnamed protein product [Prorocentrum cordatum]|uniref:Uncharacterized protein n=1 Tax=Prorocentrum cordatum TaxID=2364126 RepID=A0ABN9T830_9DINO|nr:unnamed protein product [Polarella glacialis]